jgi:hypothetical protein
MREGPAVVAVEEEEDGRMAVEDGRTVVEEDGGTVVEEDGGTAVEEGGTAVEEGGTAVEEGGMAVEEEEEGGTASGWARRGLEGKAVCSSRYELKASRLMTLHGTVRSCSGMLARSAFSPSLTRASPSCNV